MEKLQNLDKKKHELRAMHRLVESAIDILNDSVDGYDDFGRLLHENWLLKKSLSDKVSTAQIDDIYSRGMATLIDIDPPESYKIANQVSDE